MSSDLKISAAGAAAELCKRKLSFFVKEFWDVVVPNKLVWNWHMDVLCDEVQEIDELVFKRRKKKNDIIFNVPPGTSKTMIISIMSTAWEFARMPSIRVFVGSYSDNAILSIADNIRLLMKSEKYQIYFPHVSLRKDYDTKHEFKTNSNGHFYAFTVGGTLTSKHADILKVDDPLNPAQAASTAEINKCLRFFDRTLPTRKVDKEVTPTILVMQRLAVNDPTGHLLGQKNKSLGIRHICLPSEVSDNVAPSYLKENYVDGLLDNNRLSHSAIDELRIKLGASGYAGQCMQMPVPDGGLIWKKWFMEIDDDAIPSIDAMVGVGTDWDTALTKSDDNAGSAYVTAGVIDGKIFIIDAGAVYFEFPQLIKLMREKRSPHYIEAKANGKSAKQSLNRMGIPAIEVNVTGGDKVSRAKQATPFAQSGMIYIKKSLADFIYNDSRQGILFFPKGSHADLNDALCQSIHRLMGGRMISSNSGEDIFSDW